MVWFNPASKTYFENGSQFYGRTNAGGYTCRAFAEREGYCAIKGYRYQLAQYLSDWLDKPLTDIGADRAGVRERHGRITDRHGRTSADLTKRVLRTGYNRGLREHPDLPPNPCRNVDFHKGKSIVGHFL